MNTITAIAQQSLFDICLQAYGTLDGIFALCSENNLAMTDELAPGQVIAVPAFEGAQKEIVDYYAARGIKPATAITVEQMDSTTPEDDNCNYCKLFE